MSFEKVRESLASDLEEIKVSRSYGKVKGTLTQIKQITFHLRMASM